MKNPQAFLETFAMKSFFENWKRKISGKQKDLQIEMQEALMGKTSLKNLFNKMSKAEVLLLLEQNLSDINVELAGLSFICDIVVVILGYLEIDRFKVNFVFFAYFFYKKKREKEENYYRILKIVSEKEFLFHKKIQDLWTEVLNHPCLLPFKYE